MSAQDTVLQSPTSPAPLGHTLAFAARPNAITLTTTFAASAERASSATASSAAHAYVTSMVRVMACVFGLG